MSRMLFRLAIATTVGSLLFSTPTEAQVLPPLKKATRVEIIEGPELESAHDDLAIIRWTMSNPLGSDDHLGVVYYGRYPEDLRQRAESHIRLNRAHPETIFRVRISGLQPRTTYYYRVMSIESDGGVTAQRALSNGSPRPGPVGDSLLTPRGLRRGAKSARAWRRRKHHHRRPPNRPSPLTIRIRPAFSRAI